MKRLPNWKLLVSVCFCVCVRNGIAADVGHKVVNGGYKDDSGKIRWGESRPLPPAPKIELPKPVIQVPISITPAPSARSSYSAPPSLPPQNQNPLPPSRASSPPMAPKPVETPPANAFDPFGVKSRLSLPHPAEPLATKVNPLNPFGEQQPMAPSAGPGSPATLERSFDNWAGGLPATASDRGTAVREVSTAGPFSEPVPSPFKEVQGFSSLFGSPEQKRAERAADLINAFNDVSDDLRLPKGSVKNHERADLNCNAFFHGIGKKLEAAGKPSWEKDLQGMNAEQIATAIERDAAAGGNWHKIELSRNGDTWSKAQELANGGAVVVGCSHADKSGHGHVGFVSPVPLSEKSAEVGKHGPFVRDGNEHDINGQRYPSTYGAINGSKAFKIHETGWYVWTPSE